MTSILHYMSPAQGSNTPAAQVAAVSQETKCDLIAAVIILEAGGEGPNGMKAVTEVIYNRAVTYQLKSIKEGRAIDIIDSQFAVVTKKRQFCCLTNQSVAEAIAKASNHKQYGYAQRLVFDTMTGKVSNLTSGANHYCRFDCFPKWRDDKKATVRIGNHMIFKL
jgi:hypothetical protein